MCAFIHQPRRRQPNHNLHHVDSLQRGQNSFPVIQRLQVGHVAVLLQNADERKKISSLEPISIQVCMNIKYRGVSSTNNNTNAIIIHRLEPSALASTVITQAPLPVRTLSVINIHKIISTTARRHHSGK